MISVYKSFFFYPFGIEKEPYTLFAPTDLAFEQLPNKTMQILIGNKTAIRREYNNYFVRFFLFISLQ